MISDHQQEKLMEAIAKELTRMALTQNQHRLDIDRLARTLRDTVTALVTSDDVLDARIANAESVLQTIAVPGNGLDDTHAAAKRAYPVEEDPSATQPAPPKIRPRPSTWSRLKRWAIEGRFADDAGAGY